jgi:hypothetical protein
MPDNSIHIFSEASICKVGIFRLCIHLDIGNEFIWRKFLVKLDAVCFLAAEPLIFIHSKTMSAAQTEPRGFRLLAKTVEDKSPDFIFIKQES